MIMSDDKKKRASVIVAGLSKAAPSEMHEGVPEDASIAEDSAAEELIAAIESKSPKAVVEAMKSLMELCSSSAEPEEEQEA